MRFTYTAALKGYAVQATAAQAAAIAGDPLVGYVAQDQTVTLQDVQVQTGPPSWGIDRIDQRSLPLDNKYFYPNPAANGRAFVIDTGMLLSHKEFGGRAGCGFDPWGGGCAARNQGHATHVAATIGGATVGVAKGVRIISVRVFECTSATTFAIVIASIDYVTFAQQTTPSARSVANLSLGGPAFQPLDDAVNASIDANATPGVVINPGTGSPNKLLYMGMVPA